MLQLGIALLEEGNAHVQSEMLSQLRTMDVGFLASMAQLIASCSVLDWKAYERYKKSETIYSSTSLGKQLSCVKHLSNSLLSSSVYSVSHCSPYKGSFRVFFYSDSLQVPATAL